MKPQNRREFMRKDVCFHHLLAFFSRYPQTVKGCMHIRKGREKDREKTVKKTNKTIFVVFSRFFSDVCTHL